MAKLKTLAAIIVIALATIAAVEANVTGRIVGGYDADHEQFPYQISLRYKHKHTCGGSIISSNYILTAAHCVVVGTGTAPSDAKDFTIRAGTQNRIAGGIIVQVKRIIVNPKYDYVNNDLALLELERNLIYSPTIQPIQMVTEEVPEGEEIIISGWGLLDNNNANLPIILQWNKVKAISTTTCARKILLQSEAILCLDHPKGVGACGGDSGGPATYKGKLAGVSGFSAVRCGTHLPDGFAKVSYNIEWIRNNMK